MKTIEGLSRVSGGDPHRQRVLEREQSSFPRERG